jgi:hypothetical protein
MSQTDAPSEAARTATPPRALRPQGSLLASAHPAHPALRHGAQDAEGGGRRVEAASSTQVCKYVSTSSLTKRCRLQFKIMMLCMVENL